MPVGNFVIYLLWVPLILSINVFLVNYFSFLSCLIIFTKSFVLFCYLTHHWSVNCTEVYGLCWFCLIPSCLPPLCLFPGADQLDCSCLPQATMSRAHQPPLVTGISPKEGAAWTKVTIRGENLGTGPADLIGKYICHRIVNQMCSSFLLKLHFYVCFNIY